MWGTHSFSGSSSDGAVVWRDRSRGEKINWRGEKGLSLCGSSASFAPLLLWMLWPIGTFQSLCLNDPALSQLLTSTTGYMPATDGEEQRNSRESWRFFSGQFWLVWKAAPCGSMWLRWQICSDLTSWHQVHRCSTGCESLLGMGRDQTKGSVLLKAQIQVQQKEMELWAWLKMGLKTLQLKKGFLDRVIFLVFWHISVGGIEETEWFLQSCLKSI